METYSHLRFSGGPIASQREVLWKPLATWDFSGVPPTLSGSPYDQ